MFTIQDNANMISTRRNIQLVVEAFSSQNKLLTTCYCYIQKPSNRGRHRRRQDSLSYMACFFLILVNILIISKVNANNLVGTVHRGRRHDLINQLQAHNDALSWHQQRMMMMMTPSHHHSLLKTTINSTLSSNSHQLKSSPLLKDNNILSQEHVIFDEASGFHKRRHRLTENLLHFQQQRGEGKCFVYISY